MNTTRSYGQCVSMLIIILYEHVSRRCCTYMYKLLCRMSRGVTFCVCVCRGSVYNVHVDCIKMCIICKQSKNQWYIVCHDTGTTNNTTHSAYFGRARRITNKNFLGLPRLYEIAVNIYYITKAASVGGGLISISRCCCANSRARVTLYVLENLYSI